MRLRLHISCAALVISLNCLYSQEQLPGRVINMIEDIIVLSAGDRDAEDFMEEISLLAENPVRINSGDENEIKRLFFLSPFQVQSVLEYTKKHGPLLSVNELKYIHGFDKELAGLLNHFIIVDREKQTFTGRHRQLRTITNFITDTREPEAGYPGKDYKILTKLRFTGGAVEANLTLEKDRGEVFILPSYQPEYCSGNITCNNNGLLNKIIIGDYRVRFGQGLTSWNGFSPSPSPAESRIMKSRSVILPHTSSDENDFFRGLALSFDMGKIKVMTFASDIMKDATVDNDPETGNPFIRSFYTSGLHNTVTGLQKRNKFKESTLGFNVNSMTKNLYLGMSGVYSILSLPVDPGDELRDIYDFRGTKNACLALEYACLLRYSYFFGELAINESGRTAFLQGLSLNPDGRISLNILYARINRGYNSLHGKTSFSGALNRPSENLLANISSQAASFISFHGGILHKKQLWYNNISAGFPSSLQYLLRIKIDPYDNISINTDIRRSISDTYILPERGMKTSTPAKKTNFRFSLETTVSEHLFLRTRLEKTLIAGSSDNGILCYQSFNYDFSKIPLGIRCRLTVFRTGSWDSRIYAWEDDLLYNPTVKAFYGTGKRSYIMLIYRPAGALSLRLKYAVSDIPSRQEETGIIREYNLQALMRF